MYTGSRGDVSRAREAAVTRMLDAVEGELSLAAAGGLQVRGRAGGRRRGARVVLA
jgi:hypothetical protein